MTVAAGNAMAWTNFGSAFVFLDFAAAAAATAVLNGAISLPNALPRVANYQITCVRTARMQLLPRHRDRKDLNLAVSVSNIEFADGTQALSDDAADVSSTQDDLKTKQTARAAVATKMRAYS